jgi:hypothetical protein
MEPKNDRISKPFFITIVTYLLICIFQSASIKVCLLSTLIVMVTQLILLPLLPLIAGWTRHRFLPFIATLASCTISATLSFLLDSGFGFTLSGDSVILSNPSFLLIAVPLFISQAENRSAYSFSFVIKSFVGFFLFFAVTSAAREALGYGTFFGISLFSGQEALFPFFTRISGAAFLVLSLLLVCLIAYRGAARHKVVLDMDMPFYQRQPVVDQESRARGLRLFLAFFIVTFFAAILLYAFCVFIFRPAYPLFLIMTILLLGTIEAIIYVLFSKNKDFRSSYFDKTYLFPIQAGIVAFPATVFSSFDPGRENLLLYFLLIALYVLAACCSAVLVLLFIRSLRRKALFGKRPEIIVGVPYLFLILSLCLMVLSGFAEVPVTILSKIPF